MKLQQLRYAVETARRNLNVSEAAEALFTSQPGVSKQIRLLEEEIGVPIFVRSGKRIVAVTQAGEAVLATAEHILHNVQKIKHIGSEFAQRADGVLTVAATASQLRFRLPETVAAFAAAWPQVRLRLRSGSPEEVAAMVRRGEADLAVSSEPPAQTELKSLLGARWHYALVLSKCHPLADLAALSLQDLTVYPLITYDYAFGGRSVFARALARVQAAAAWRQAFVSDDNEALITYVRLGLGAGLLDMAACERGLPEDVLVRDVSDWFEPAYTRVLVRGDLGVSAHARAFIACLLPHLRREEVERLLNAEAADDFSI